MPAARYKHADAKAADALAFAQARRYDRGHLRFLVAVGQPRGAAIELVRHIEQMLGEFVYSHTCQQHASDPQVNFGAVLFWDQ